MSVCSNLAQMTTHALPSDLSRTAHSADKVPYRIHPICAEDADREREFICGLSEASRYSRLMYAVRDLRPNSSIRWCMLTFNAHALVALIR